MKTLILYWFKIQAANAAHLILSPHFSKDEVGKILRSYWQRYRKLKPEVPSAPTMGGSIMVHLAAMSTAFYKELTRKGKNEESTSRLLYDIAWIVYQKMGRISWWLTGWGNRNGYSRLLKATKLFRSFPFNSPSYHWKDVIAGNNIVGFDCLKCPVAEYFETKELSRFCTKTWCALDYPLAEIWNAKLERTGSIAGGAIKCDFRWKSINSK